MFPTFDHPPTIDLLSHLTSGTLNQPNNLAKALRLWTILQTLYSEETDPLPPSFTSAQWRNLHYPNGFPLHTAHTLLKNTPIDLHTWTIDYTHRYPKEAPHLTQRLQEIPFKISDRTLRNDFATLATLGWLHPQGSGNQRQYQRTPILPTHPQTTPLTHDRATHPPITTSQLIPNDLTLIADQFFTPINGQQRFILDLENIMSSDLSHQLTHFLQQLHQLWQAPLTSPIRLQYRSARRYQAEFDLITYPVCIYYCQRAPYLFAYGQTPNTPDTLAWYDYRLDHILNITPITWADVPPTWLPKNGSTHPIPPKFLDKTPQKVFNEVSQALGFEIHRPIAQLLLRFDRYFFANYIQDTEREKLFTQISYTQASRIFNTDRNKPDIPLQTLFQPRPNHTQDIFCLTDHRSGDNNVIMRLRAWGHNVEVLLPWNLRQRMGEDLTKAQSFYNTP